MYQFCTPYTYKLERCWNVAIKEPVCSTNTTELPEGTGEMGMSGEYFGKVGSR